MEKSDRAIPQTAFSDRLACRSSFNTPMQDQSADIQDLPHLFASIFEKDERVKFAYLFGSAAREEQNNLSDIDIAVYLREDCDPAEAKLDIIGKLMDRLGRGRFDLVILNTAPLPLAARVIRCRKVLADRDPFSRHRYESRILREYFDFSVLEKSILNRRFALGR
jgi:predicted nucleotidyltransferase